MPVGMVVPTMIMVVAGVALTIWAGPIFDFASTAAGDLSDRGVYLSAVLGGPR